jgi:hypothetical protein
MKDCKVSICEQPTRANGYCNRHAQQYYNHGKIINPYPSRRLIRNIKTVGEYSYIPLGSAESKYSDVFAIIDTEHINKVKNFNWGYSSGYARQTETKEYLHRLLTNAPAHLHVDHINGNKLDNRLDNLRVCTQAQNNRNSKKPITNTSGYKGVSFCKKRKKYVAYISHSNKHYYLGSFDEPLRASQEYETAAIKLFGEYANAKR